MACNNVEQLFLEHSMLLPADISKQILSTDFYIRELQKEAWLDGQGVQISYPVYERSLPSSPVTFVDWATSPGDGDTGTTNENPAPVAGGACALAGQKIESFGVTTRTASLKKAALNGPDICLDDLRFAWQVEAQIKNMVRVLSENSKKVWSDAYSAEYGAACGNKVIATDGLPGFGDDSWDVTTPTSKLTWGILEAIYEQMVYNGGSMNPALRIEDETPVFDLVGDWTTFQDLKLSDDNTRADLRYADPKQLIAAPGLGNAVYRGFRFKTVILPPRYDIVDGAWVERKPYDDGVAATRGKKFNVSDEYKNALFTETRVFHKDVMKILTPKPNVARGGLTYNPAYSWTGEFVWRNIPSRDCNPDGNIGFFRALYGYGAKIERPELGFAIRHLRCDRALDLKSCSA